MDDSKDIFSAGAQGIGYIFQGRFALFKMLQLPESTALFIEKDDDLEFDSINGKRDLASLKHKKKGQKLSDLSTDFWKSVNIWLARYDRDDRTLCNHKYSLFTTNDISEGSFLAFFSKEPESRDNKNLLKKFVKIASQSKQSSIQKIYKDFIEFDDSEQLDFVSRISIYASTVRIDDIPSQVKESHLRTIRPKFRDHVYEKLEGWWTNQIIEMLVTSPQTPMCGRDLSEKMYSIAEEYRNDNLPIDYLKVKAPLLDTNSAKEQLYICQLKEIGVKDKRIQTAIRDYYCAFQQRASWAREDVLLNGEVEDFEERLIDEWERYRDCLFDELDDDLAEDELRKAGAELFNWAQFSAVDMEKLRIREKVKEPYVIRGNFHILANKKYKNSDGKTTAKVYWHPKFLERIDLILNNQVSAT